MCIKNIQRELAAIRHLCEETYEQHDVFKEVLAALEEGRIDGVTFYDVEKPIGCFYGHIAAGMKEGNYSRAMLASTLATQIFDLGYHEDDGIYTFIEQAIITVGQGETDKTSEILAQLKEALTTA